MGKHAYLIMAHNNFYILEKLLLLLDDPRNDIYLHIDKKVSDFDFAYYQRLCRKARVIYPAKRIDVRWGTQSQVITELLLYKTAYANSSYFYYHLLSGVDLPLRTQDEIHDFFGKSSCEFVYFKNELSSYDFMRVSRYHFPPTRYGFLSKVRGIVNYCQDILHIDRTKKLNITVKRGRNWCDLTQCAVEKLLKREKEILKFTRLSLCADEVYKQTFLPSDELKICNNDLRLVDWSRSPNGKNPHIFTIDDWDMLLNSDKMFARKFDVNADKSVVDKLFAYIMEKQFNEQQRKELA